MLKLIVPILAVLLLIPAAQAQSGSIDSAGKSDIWCQEILNVALVINAGEMCLHVQYEHQVGRIGDVVQYAGIVNMPVLGALAMPVGTAVFSPVNGCTASALTTGFTNTATGANFRFRGSLTLIDTTCTGYIEITIQLTAVITAVVWWYPITIVSNEPNLSGSINVPDVALEIDEWRADMCDNPAGHGHCELHLHGGVDVECTGCNSTLSVGSINITNNQGNQTVEPEGFDNSLYVLFLFVALALLHVGERNADNIYRMFSGLIFLFLGAISIWEQSKLGFDEVPGLIIPAWGFMLLLGFYLIIPKGVISGYLEKRKRRNNE